MQPFYSEIVQNIIFLGFKSGQFEKKKFVLNFKTYTFFAANIESKAPQEHEGNIQTSEENPENPDTNYDDDDWEDLSIEELASLFLNFKTLDESTSTQLLAYMKRLETSNPAKLTEFKQHIQTVKNSR